MVKSPLFCAEEAFSTLSATAKDIPCTTNTSYISYQVCRQKYSADRNGNDDLKLVHAPYVCT